MESKGTDYSYSKVLKLLRIGILGGILSFAGDLFLGWTVYPETGNYYGSLIAGCAELSDLRYGLGAIFGALGIPFTSFVFCAVGAIIGSSSFAKASKHEKIIKAGSYSMAFWGAAVHLLCVAVMCTAKMEFRSISDFSEFTLSSAPDLLPYSLSFAEFVVLPVAVLLIIPYIISCTVIFMDIVSKRTVLPRWACIFNPLIFKFLLNAMSKSAPNSCLFNGIRMSNMSFGALVTFVGIMILLKLNQKKA